MEGADIKRVVGTQYKDVWTKEPHGGPYKKARADRLTCLHGSVWSNARQGACSCGHVARVAFGRTDTTEENWGPPGLHLQSGRCGGGYDALTQQPDGSIIRKEPGARPPRHGAG
jgi:hypothetical protein